METKDQQTAQSKDLASAAVSARAATLLQVLEELSKHYQALDDSLRLERESLIAADLPKLAERTKAKEKILYKIRAVDKERVRAALEFGQEIGLTDMAPRLLGLADQCVKKGQGKLALFLREKHKVLGLHIQRAQEHNADNEAYANSALQALQGSMNEIKQTVTETPTYGKKGQMSGTIETQAGNFVRKEV